MVAAVRARPALPRISVVVPALNEAANLRAVLPALPPVHEVILVDGGSVDSTVEVAQSLVPGLVAVTQTRRGKGNALAAGFAKVTGDVVVMVDADGSADPAEIPRFVAALVDGADVAQGARPRHRRRGLLRARTNVSAFWADLVPLLELPDHEHEGPVGGALLWGEGFEVETLISCRFAGAGLTIAEVPAVGRAVSDGLGVLRTLRTERARVRRNTARLGRSPAAG
jgi:glycosyltransferase involved in cell wall biosynthesis